MAEADQALPAIGSLWNYAKPQLSRERFMEVVATHDLSQHPDYALQIQTQIARTHSLEGTFDLAHDILDKVQAELKDEFAIARVRYLLERGRCFNSAGRPAEALPLFEEAASVAESAQDWRLAIDAVHMVAIAAPTQAEKIAQNIRGLEMVKAHPEQEGWLWALYNNLGEEYMVAGEYEKAHETFQKLLAFQIENQGNADMYTLKDDAKALRLMGRPAQSNDQMQTVLQHLLNEHQDDGWIREEIAEALLAMGRAQEAHPHFVRAHEMLSNDPYCQKHAKAKLERLAQMAAQKPE